MRGGHKRIRRQNEREALEAHQRDRLQKDRLVFRQLQDRKRLEAFHNKYSAQEERLHAALTEDRDRFASMAGPQSRSPDTQSSQHQSAKWPSLDR